MPPNPDATDAQPILWAVAGRVVFVPHLMPQWTGGLGRRVPTTPTSAHGVKLTVAAASSSTTCPGHLLTAEPLTVTVHQLLLCSWTRQVTSWRERGRNLQLGRNNWSRMLSTRAQQEITATGNLSGNVKTGGSKGLDVPETALCHTRSHHCNQDILWVEAGNALFVWGAHLRICCTCIFDKGEYSASKSNNVHIKRMVLTLRISSMYTISRFSYHGLLSRKWDL